MEIKSILIKDTTREERIRIQEGLNQCGGACDSATVVIIWAVVPWIHFMNRTLTGRRNCGS